MDLSGIEGGIRDSLETKQRLLQGDLGPVGGLLSRALGCVKAGGRLFFCGNGGSACDAAHAVCELVGWFRTKERGPLPAIALGQEIPSLTAISNDVGYVEAFARQLEALGRKGDLLVGISTSGGSRNVLRALETGKRLGLFTVALTGGKAGPCGEAADLWVSVPSTDTPRIQESHLLILHLLCDFLEQEAF